MQVWTKVIGVGRFRILGGGGQALDIRGGGGEGGKFLAGTPRRNDVASTSFQRHVPTSFLKNQFQVQLITFLILKSDIIDNSRIELRGIVMPVPSNQIKVTFMHAGLD